MTFKTTGRIFITVCKPDRHAADAETLTTINQFLCLVMKLATSKFCNCLFENGVSENGPRRPI